MGKVSVLDLSPGNTDDDGESYSLLESRDVEGRDFYQVDRSGLVPGKYGRTFELEPIGSGVPELD